MSRFLIADLDMWEVVVCNDVEGSFTDRAPVVCSESELLKARVDRSCPPPAVYSKPEYTRSETQGREVCQIPDLLSVAENAQDNRRLFSANIFGSRSTLTLDPKPYSRVMCDHAVSSSDRDLATWAAQQEEQIFWRPNVASTSSCCTSPT